VVNPLNANANVSQWLEAGEVNQETGRVRTMNWGNLHTWSNSGSPRVSLYSIDGLGHALSVKKRKSGSGRSTDPYVALADISATVELMRLWGLVRV